MDLIIKTLFLKKKNLGKKRSADDNLTELIPKSEDI